MSSGTCEFGPVDYKSVKPARNKSVLILITSRNVCRDGENGGITRYEQLALIVSVATTVGF
jgi:hypothetical protein